MPSVVAPAAGYPKIESVNELQVEKEVSVFFVLIKNFHERSNLERVSKGSVEVSDSWSSFSSKLFFIEAVFHQMLLGEDFHRTYIEVAHSSNEWVNS